MRGWRAVAAIVVAGAACRADGQREAARHRVADRSRIGVAPLPDSTIPNDSLGTSIRRGRALFMHTPDSLPRYALSALACTSCHADGGRRANALPVMGAFARYPRYLDREARVASIEDRVNYCMTRSLAGRALPDTTRAMHDFVSYLAFLAKGVPLGTASADSRLPQTSAVGDSTRGAAIFAGTCAACHGADGHGSAAAPPLWGPRSFDIGASMARTSRATAFIQRAMPADRPGTLTEQQAADLAAYIDAHPRPDFPGKARDWPQGNAPSDVPYATAGHSPTHPTPVLARNDR